MDLSRAMRTQLAQAVLTAVEAAVAPRTEETVTFTALEAAIEVALHQAGATVLTQLVRALGTGFVGATRPCPCGGEQTTDHYATTTRQTVVGAVPVQRAAYRCATCGWQGSPLDAQLQLSTARLSPHLQSRVALLSALLPFAEASTVLAAVTGVQVTAKTTQVSSEALGTAVAAVQATTDPVAPPGGAPARVYLGMDGVMYCTVDRDADGKRLWREAKVGVFYTAAPSGAPGTGRRSRLAPDGWPIDLVARDSQSYVVHMGSWHAFAEKVWREGLRRGWWQAQEIIVVGDGAKWITSLIDEHLRGLPGRVVQILDLRHAEDHLWAVAHACLSNADTVRWIQEPLEHLRHGRVAELAAMIRALPTDTAMATQLVATTAAYDTDRQAQMDYPAVRAQGMPIGSGLAESACKRLVGGRAKGPGMHWTVAGAQAIGTLRAAYLSRRWPEVEYIARAS